MDGKVPKYLLFLCIPLSVGLSCSKVDKSIHRVNLYPLDSAVGFLNSDFKQGLGSLFPPPVNASN